MIKAEKTLTAVDKIIFDEQESSHRKHLGASILGGPCARELWYIFRWTLDIDHRAQLLRLFERGHQTEPRMVKWLRDAGITVFEVDNTGEQYRISDIGGHFGGSMDGIGVNIPDLPPGIYVVLEFKTHNQKSFDDLVKKGVKESKFQHYVQMQIYMKKSGLKHALYMAINKNTDELHLEIVHLDEDCATTYLARAERVITTKVAPPRINENPTWYQCKWCDFRNVCHHSVPADINCRTCRYASAAQDKQWLCQLGNVVEDYLHTGCSNHRYFPEMVGGYQQSAPEDSHGVRERLIKVNILS